MAKHDARPIRSILFVGGDDVEQLGASLDFGADAIICDLEEPREPFTDDMRRLVGFYATVTGVEPIWYTEDFAELRTPTATLAIGSTRTVALFGEGVARAAANHTAIIEFRVADVDAIFAQLVEKLEKALVQPPTTMPWGNRSLLFRDPDGNLVNFFTPVSVEAVKRAGK